MENKKDISLQATWSTTDSTANSVTLQPSISEDYKLKGKKVLCGQCGHNKHRIANRPGMVLTVMPPIQISFYICDKCGHEFSIKRQSSMPSDFPATEVLL